MLAAREETLELLEMLEMVAVAATAVVVEMLDVQAQMELALVVQEEILVDLVGMQVIVPQVRLVVLVVQAEEGQE